MRRVGQLLGTHRGPEGGSVDMSVQTQQSPGLQQEIGVLWAHAPIFAVGTKFKDFMFKILSEF